MARTISHTPSWLSRPSAGFDFFSGAHESKAPSTQSNPEAYNGHKRTIAQRGTEIFKVVNNELRWSDLLLLKDQWQALQEPASPTDSQNATEHFWRVLKIPVSMSIEQLIISPSGEYLAILTSHTAHIALLPDSSHLSSDDYSPIKVKTFQLGPTAHVRDMSAIVTALWHPLGDHESCLVTITVDAVVRLWQLDKGNRWSFDAPERSIDLKKLAGAELASDDVSASTYGSNKGFSPDSFEMEVSAACFGGIGDGLEQGWAPMTLWIAMRAGDIYALCPLIPARVQLSDAAFGSLESVIKAGRAFGKDGENGTSEDVVSLEQQTWLKTFESSGPRANGYRDAAESAVYSWTFDSGPILQGPFTTTPDEDQIFDISDIVAIPGLGNLENDDDNFISHGAEPYRPPSFGILCITTSEGIAHVCLTSTEVEGLWLPMSRREITQSATPELLLVESLKFNNTNSTYRPVISSSSVSKKILYITHYAGVTSLDLTPWMNKLDEELESEMESGATFRLGLVADKTSSLAQHIIKVPRLNNDSTDAEPLSASVSILDSDLGHVVMTATESQASMVTLATEDLDAILDKEDDEVLSHEIPKLLENEARHCYQPPQEFWYKTGLNSFLDEHVHDRHRRSMKEEVKFSPVAFSTMMEAHRLLSHETTRLGYAAADLFRRCERLQDEFVEQIRRANEIAQRIEDVVDEDDEMHEDDDEVRGLRPKTEKRIDAAKARQAELSKRIVEVRRKLGKLGGRRVNEKEQAWINEIQNMDDWLEVQPEKTKPESFSHTNGNSSRDENNENGSEASQDEKDSFNTPQQPRRQPQPRSDSQPTVQSQPNIDSQDQSQIPFSQRLTDLKTLAESLISQYVQYDTSTDSDNIVGSNDTEDDPYTEKPYPTKSQSQQSRPHTPSLQSSFNASTSFSTSTSIASPQKQRDGAAKIRDMLEREAALIDATRSRLERLNVSI